MSIGVLSRWRRSVSTAVFSKVGHENGGGPVNARWTATVAFAVLSRWRRSVLRGQFSEVGRKWWCRGQPSSRRWRQEHAAGEAAKRMSALSGIGAGKYESVATAAGGDDADNSSPGGFSPARHRCKRQRWGSLYKYLWRLRCESPLVRSWRRARQRWGPLNEYLSDVDSQWSSWRRACGISCTRWRGSRAPRLGQWC